MKPKELLRLVWINITQNKFKVIMTSIGIIVGAATIVMVIAIGKGGQADVADQFKNLNAGAVEISYDGGTDVEALAAVLAEHPPAIWEAVPHREARRRADHRGERCLPVTAAVCRIWEAFSADRAIRKTA